MRLKARRAHNELARSMIVERVSELVSLSPLPLRLPLAPCDTLTSYRYFVGIAQKQSATQRSLKLVSVVGHGEFVVVIVCACVGQISKASLSDKKHARERGGEGRGRGSAHVCSTKIFVVHQISFDSFCELPKNACKSLTISMIFLC